MTDKEKILVKLHEKADNYTCFICKTKYKSKAGLTRHLNSSQEYQHQQYREHLKRLQATYQDIEDDTYKQLGCDKCKCDQCSADTLKKCVRGEKTLFLDVKKRFKKAQLKKEKVVAPPKKKNSNSAKALVQEFYEKTNSFSPNFQLDIIKVNNYLKKGVSPDCIREAFKLLQDKGEISLQYFGKYVISEAIHQAQMRQELEDPSSLPSLIIKYYQASDSACSLSLLYKNYERLKELIQAYNLSSDQIKYAIEYMINHQIASFNFINHTLPQILREYNENKRNQLATQRYNSEDYYIESALQNLSQGKTTYDATVQMYGNSYNFEEKITSLLKEKKYNQNYSAIEWLYRINLPLTSDLYFLAKEITQQQQIGLSHFSTEQETNQFIYWLKNYKQQFE